MRKPIRRTRVEEMDEAIAAVLEELFASESKGQKPARTKKEKLKESEPKAKKTHELKPKGAKNQKPKADHEKATFELFLKGDYIHDIIRELFPGVKTGRSYQKTNLEIQDLLREAVRKKLGGNL